MAKLSPARIVGAFLNSLANVSPKSAGKLAFYLFGLPKRKKQKAKETAFLATGELRYEQINGRKTAVYRWGNTGPIALLAHGWESHAGRWRKLAPMLVQAGFQVVAVDAPAHGRTAGRHFTMLKYAEVLLGIQQRIGPIDTLIGHSVGGAATIWMMHQLKPAERPRQAVVLASFSSLEYIMENARRLVNASPAMMQAMDEYIEQKTGHRIPHYSLTQVVKNLGTVESLLIHDRQDRVTAFRESEALHAAWPGSRLLATEGYGHGLTAPPVFEAVLEFLQIPVEGQDLAGLTEKTC